MEILELQLIHQLKLGYRSSRLGATEFTVFLKTDSKISVFSRIQINSAVIHNNTAVIKED